MTADLLVGLPATRLAYLVLFLLIGGESAGIPLRGETAWITASLADGFDARSGRGRRLVAFLSG